VSFMRISCDTPAFANAELNECRRQWKLKLLFARPFSVWRDKYQ